MVAFPVTKITLNKTVQDLISAYKRGEIIGWRLVSYGKNDFGLMLYSKVENSTSYETKDTKKAIELLLCAVTENTLAFSEVFEDSDLKGFYFSLSTPDK